ncbi:ribosomal RNA-processing protein 8 [Cylindrobasidium torrendii FP15055 ss-10]|uniref:Ribosomal RNA-processing protein 8 n=1 Tax=Cylindrobasidium torrendii FP15055 ss-10 TaxID=1314674 RepID=A0A0D7BVV1_9AGAR|nr:ribosomal RNA-processing protein 8 [Cylindrobasidium torrendii FP15055 ss-10]
MALFDVPGWSVKADPVADASPRKRKRSPVEPGNDINLQKLVSKLSHKDKDVTANHNKKDRKLAKDKEKSKKRMSREDIKNSISLPKALKPVRDRSPSTASSSNQQPPAKKAKTKHVSEPSTDLQPRKSSESTSGLTEMQKSMKQSLSGARFRMINERLYKTTSDEAVSMMEQDSSVFEDYHEGFRHQVQSWPTNPVEMYIEALSSSPAGTIIADLGCGDAALARALLPKGLAVLSYDLVSDNSFVIAADICHRIPLPGSEPTGPEKSNGEAQIVDVAVCALSLMGTNWPICIREAWRILRHGGQLKIAEVVSRFVNVKHFIALITAMGFSLTSKDTSNTHFSMFEFKKVPRCGKTEDEWEGLLQKGNLLKPCEYKRR